MMIISPRTIEKKRREKYESVKQKEASQNENVYKIKVILIKQRICNELQTVKSFFNFAILQLKFTFHQFKEEMK
ncbi:hypothetical protein [Methanimicrococcus hacksteinii]|uniref:hypothetical protein n=1 Tax=Methanimicrococcus hacksteinii TaxID=3028293 RepID=UPI00298ED921|nr:hypothetical protein [Methanimicrococcus sp. At1]